MNAGRNFPAIRTVVCDSEGNLIGIAQPISEDATPG